MKEKLNKESFEIVKEKNEKFANIQRLDFEIFDLSGLNDFLKENILSILYTTIGNNVVEINDRLINLVKFSKKLDEFLKELKESYNKDNDDELNEKVNIYLDKIYSFKESFKNEIKTCL